MIRIRITERGKDLSAYPEIGMIHVRPFRCLGHAQSDAAEFSGSHLDLLFSRFDQGGGLQTAVVQLQPKSNCSGGL